MKTFCICLLCLVAGTFLIPAAGCSKGPAAGDPQAGTLTAAAKRLTGAWKGTESMEVSSTGLNGAKQTTKQSIDIGVDFKPGGAVQLDMLLEASGTWEVIKAEGAQLTVKIVLELQDFSGEAKMEDGQMKETTQVATKKQAKEFLVVFESDDRINMAPTDDPTDKKILDRAKK